MQQQVVMPQNLNMAHFGHPGDVPSLSLAQQQDLQSYPVPQVAFDLNPPASAPLHHTQGFSFDEAATDNHKLVTLDVLKSMLPDGYPEDRPRAGLLPDGQAYAPGPPQAKNQYLLFASKSSYIAYYIKFYFSETNLARDNYIIGLMIDGNSLPISKLVEFPRLAAVNTTIQDVENAVANNKLLEIIKLPSTNSPCVRRVDGIPTANRPDVMSAPPTVTMSPDTFSTTAPDITTTKNNSNSSVNLMWPQQQQQQVYAETPVSTTTWSAQPTTSPRGGPAQFLASPNQFSNVVVAMNALNLAGSAAAAGGQQLRYYTQQPQTNVSAAATAGATDFYQQHQPVFLMNSQGLVLAHPFAAAAAFTHHHHQQGPPVGGNFASQTGQPAQQQQQQHHGMMAAAPPGMISLQQQQALAALQQQQFVAMQQGFVAAASPALNQYNVGLANHHQQMLQQHAAAAAAAANTMVPGAPGNTTGPPPGLTQPISHWAPQTSGAIFSPPPPPQQPQQQQQQQQQTQQVMAVAQPLQPQSANSSPPGMPKPTGADNNHASGTGTPIPSSGTPSGLHSRAPSNATASAIPAVNSSSGRSSSSGIASGVSSQNSTSVVVVSSGSSSSVSSSSTTSGIDSNSGKHAYAAVVAKQGVKPEEVSVAKLGGGPTPGGPSPMYHQSSHRGNKSGGGGFYRPKMNNGGSFEENNNHGSYGGGGGSWRGGHHRGGSGMRGNRGGHYMQHQQSQQQQQHQGSYNQVASGSAPPLARGPAGGDAVSGQGGPQGKKEGPKVEPVSHPLVQEG